MRVIRAVKESNNKVYIIADDYDIFATDLLFQIDTSTSDLGLSEYTRAGGTADAYDILDRFAHLVKNDLYVTCRSFMTYSTPRYICPGVHLFVMVEEVCKRPLQWVEAAAGFTYEEVRQGLSHIYPTQPELVEAHMMMIRTEYDGYRFHKEQVNSVYNSQQVMYYLDALDKTGEPPQPLIDSSIAQPDSAATRFIITNYYKHKSIHDKLQLLIGNYNTTTLIPPYYYTAHLFKPDRVDITMMMLAYAYGYLTYADPKVGKGLLIATNAVYKDIMYEALGSEIGGDKQTTAVLKQYKLARWRNIGSLLTIPEGTKNSF